MEPEGSQEPSTDPILGQIFFSLTPKSSTWSLPSGFPTKDVYAFLISRAFHGPMYLEFNPPWFDPPNKKSTNYDVPRYVIFSSIMFFPLSQVHTYSSSSLRVTDEVLQSSK